MDVSFWAIAIFVLLLMSAFFSGTETAMMALNRYRLRYWARRGDKRAQRVIDLLKRPDRLLGVVLIGNTFTNIIASAVMTLLAIRLYGDVAVLPASILLTFLILIMSETAPKTVAATHSEKISLFVSGILTVLLRIFYPLVVCINSLANGLLKCLRVSIQRQSSESLSKEELVAVVNEAADSLTPTYQSMLLQVLSLEEAVVDDVMVPRNEMVGIDVTQPLDEIQKQLVSQKVGYWLLYRETVDAVVGVVSTSDFIHALMQESLSIPMLLSSCKEVGFVPEGTVLSQQLRHFQQGNQLVSLVVDEYGDIIGLITFQDIIEEIVGDFSEAMAPSNLKVDKLAKNHYQVDATIGVRDLNRLLGLSLSVDGPKTLSGLLIEKIEALPAGPFCLAMDNLLVEVLRLEGNTIAEVELLLQEPK